MAVIEHCLHAGVFAISWDMYSISPQGLQYSITGQIPRPGVEIWFLTSWILLMCFNLTLNLHLYDMYNDKPTREYNTKHCVYRFQLWKNAFSHHCRHFVCPRSARRCPVDWQVSKMKAFGQQALCHQLLLCEHCVYRLVNTSSLIQKKKKMLSSHQESLTKAKSKQHHGKKQKNRPDALVEG